MDGILIVNPNGDERKAMADAMAMAGRPIVEVGSIGEALEALAQHGFDHLVSVRALPDGSGELLAQQAAEVSPQTRVTLATNFSEVKGASDILRFDFADYIIRVDDFASLVAGAGTAAAPNQKELVECFIRTVEMVVGLVELSDPLNAGNAASSLRLAEGIATELGLSEERRQEIAMAALLHDIGNFALRPGVLGKSEALGPEEEESIRTHTTRGVQLLDHISFPWNIKPIIRHHHERYDGDGYPDRKKGREIPIGARILAVVDAYVSMTTSRPHRPAMSHEQAVKEIQSHVGAQFDPEVVEAFNSFVKRREQVSGDVFQVKVLVIGGPDEPLSRIKLQFLREDFKVLSSVTLEESLETVVKEDVRFIVADITSRWDEALALLEGVQKRIESTQTDVLFFDGEGSRERRIIALDNGTEEVFPMDVSPSEVISRMRRILRKEQAVRRNNSPGVQKAGIQGDLSEMNLAEIIQMLSMGQKTAKVSVETPGGKGALFLEGGRLIHAEWGRKGGAKALNQLMSVVEGQFQIVHGVTSDKRSIDRDAMSVLLDLAREADEEGREVAQA